MKDSWLRAAISDDTIVADLLLRLKESPPPSSTTSSSLQHTVVLSLKSWGVRQPRSKPPSTTTTTTTSTSPVFETNTSKTPHRRSPTTPLSWTCTGAAVSPSDDSLSSLHLPPPSDRFRSKVSASTDAPTATTSKRPRRKKTFAELKEEESSLLKERIHLKKELASLRVRVKEQRSMNEKLKRMKLDHHVEPRIKSEANSVDEPFNNTSNAVSEAASSSATRLVDKLEDTSEPESQKQRATSQEQLFVLPDLNMDPEEDTVGMS